jgi:hypothetical protein
MAAKANGVRARVEMRRGFIGVEGLAFKTKAALAGAVVAWAAALWGRQGGQSERQRSAWRAARSAFEPCGGRGQVDASR